MTAGAGVPCPRCQAGPWMEVGRLAAHLVDVHGQSAAVALADARKALGVGTAAPVTPADREVIAKRLGVKPTHPIVSDMLQRTGVAVIDPDSQGGLMAKKKRAQQKCRNCHKPGHNSKSCTEKPAAPLAPRPAALRKDGMPRGSVRTIAGAADVAAKDFATTARESAKATVRRKIEEELAWARDYVVELERLVAGA